MDDDYGRESMGFIAEVRRERERVDRHGGGFALVVIDLPARAADTTGCRALMLHVRQATRSLDLAGRLDAERVGVLLIGTNREGAMAFVSRLRAGLPVPPLRILAYPHAWEEIVESLAREGAPSAAPAAELFASLIPGAVPAGKRVVDVAGSLLGLLLLAPLFALVAVYIKLVSPGRIFFRQVRVGRGGRPFTVLKFRTMHEHISEEAHRAYLRKLIRDGKPMSKLDDGRDRRIFTGGGLLRRTALDELPQLVNVLRGDMSLVGPRPCIPYEAREYEQWHARRFDAMPGMSGLWQVSGKNRLAFEQMVRLDISYARRQSLLLDASILLRTVPTLLGMAGDALGDVRGRIASRYARRTAGAAARAGEGAALAERRLSHV